MKHHFWRSVRGSDGERLYAVGINADGTLINPNGYPEGQARAAALAADERWHQKRSAASKRAAETRRMRQERRTHEAAHLILKGEGVGRQRRCYVCTKKLRDHVSVERGIGSECWQRILDLVERLREEHAEAVTRSRLRLPTEEMTATNEH